MNQPRSNLLVTVWLILVCLTAILIASLFASDAPELRSLSTDRMECVSDGKTMHCMLRSVAPALPLPHGWIEPRSAPRLPAGGTGWQNSGHSVAAAAVRP